MYTDAFATMGCTRVDKGTIVVPLGECVLHDHIEQDDQHVFVKKRICQPLLAPAGVLYLVSNFDYITEGRFDCYLEDV